MARAWQDHPQKMKRLKAQPTPKTDANHGWSTRVSAQGSEAGSYQEGKEPGFQTLDLSLQLSVTASPACRVGVRAPKPTPAVQSQDRLSQGRVPGETGCSSLV